MLLRDYALSRCAQKSRGGKEADPMMRSSSEVQNYEVSRQISTRKMPSAKIQKITVAVLLREQMIVGPMVNRKFKRSALTKNKKFKRWSPMHWV